MLFIFSKFKVSIEKTINEDDSETKNYDPQQSAHFHLSVVKAMKRKMCHLNNKGNTSMKQTCENPDAKCLQRVFSLAPRETKKKHVIY